MTALIISIIEFIIGICGGLYIGYTKGYNKAIKDAAEIVVRKKN